MTRTKNSPGFSTIESLLILVVIGILGFTGWFVYHSQKAANKSYASQAANQSNTAQKSITSTTPDAKTQAMASWSTFSDATIGLTFKYPSDWGHAKLQTMNPTPDKPSGTFYKVSFDTSKFPYLYLTVTPKAALQGYSTTFSSIKSDNSKLANSRHVFIDEAMVVGDIVPSTGNQDAEIYAARTISLAKVDASDIVLVNAHPFNETCTQAAYPSCYSPSDLNSYQWLLENMSVL